MTGMSLQIRFEFDHASLLQDYFHPEIAEFS